MRTVTVRADDLEALLGVAATVDDLTDEEREAIERCAEALA